MSSKKKRKNKASSQMKDRKEAIQSVFLSSSSPVKSSPDASACTHSLEENEARSEALESPLPPSIVSGIGTLTISEPIESKAVVVDCVNDLKVVQTAAGTRRGRTERNRVLISPHISNQLGVESLSYVIISKSEEDSDAPSKSFLATVSLLDINDDEIQLSKSLKTLVDCAFGIGAKVSCRRLNLQLDVRRCASVRVRLEGFDQWSRQAVVETQTSEHVNNYVLQLLVEHRFIATDSTLGIVLNGYPCHAVVEEIMFSTPDRLDSDEAPTELSPIVGVVDWATMLRLVHTDPESHSSSSENIPTFHSSIASDNSISDALAMGGMSRCKKEIFEILERSFWDRDAGNHYRGAPRGILLFGPPGTGKTLLARYSAKHFGTRLCVVNGAEIVGRNIGDAETKIREVFTDAQMNQSCIVFFDEIDSLCPSRDSSGNDRLHSRIVACVSQCLDNMVSNTSEGIKQNPSVSNRVVVMAATNRIDAVDPVLRRPGRFDREIEIGIPNEDDRVEILNVHLSSMVHNLGKSSVDNFARDLHGFVGADILGLCREASWQALRRTVSSSSNESDSVCVCFEDLMKARSLCSPSALREFAVEVPHVKWSDIGGQKNVKYKLIEAVEWPLKRPEVFVRMGIRPPQGVLLYGPPGCSKTLLAKAIATESRMNFIAVKGPELFNQWVGESERALRELFAKARLAEPTVIFFDEIDAVASARSGGDDGDGCGGVTDRVLSQLLQEMDGVEERKRIVVVAATNRPDILDPALLRPGRIDRMVYVPPPDKEAREEIFKIHTSGIIIGADVDYEKLLELSEGYSGAEIAALCREACMAVLQESLDASEVYMRHFEQAAASLKPQITREMIDFYESFATERTL